MVCGVCAQPPACNPRNPNSTANNSECLMIYGDQLACWDGYWEPLYAAPGRPMARCTGGQMGVTDEGFIMCIIDCTDGGAPWWRDADGGAP
jgi:hypothetical protein